jgi:hypothetical protein
MRIPFYRWIALSPAALLSCLLPAQGQTGLTVYNQGFAVVRQPITLNLKAGVTEVSETGVTALVEPDSVVLRDLSSPQPIRILEQNYDGSLRIQQQMLAKFEGQTLNFEVGSGPEAKFVTGKLLRSGSIPRFNQFGYQQPELQEEPLVEVEGKIRYGLPGTPLFPADAPGLTLHPTLNWLISSEKAAKLNAELDYITTGLSWEATYNVISPPESIVGSSQKLALNGWVDVTNETGSDFSDVKLQLMAGDVSKLQNNNGGPQIYGRAMSMATTVDVSGTQQQISQKTFDDYHLYDLHRTTTLRNHQTKQIEFINAVDIPAERIYVYDGLKLNENGQQNIYYQWNQENFGTGVNRKVWITEEFKNADANHLGIPLPAGRMRFYRRDTDGSLQFVGENKIDHTPKDETVHVYLGNAFDLTGERTRTDFKSIQQERMIIESFRIVVRNAKDTATPVKLVEHLYRTANWEISKNSDPFVKKDAATVEYKVEVPAHGEKTVTYTVTYTW